MGIAGSYTEWRPRHLARWVELIWQYRGPSNHIYKRVFPSSRVELVVNLGAPYRIVGGDGLEWLTTAALTGVHSHSFVLEQPPSQDVLAFRLRPPGAYALIARPLSEVTDLSVDLDDVVGRRGAELAELCHGARSVDDRFRIAARWLEQRIAGSPAAPGLAVETPIAWVAAQVERTGGAASIAALRDATGMSKTRLATSFRQQMGVTPKLYARLVRFRRATALLCESSQPLAQVALEAGYYDQPHMNGEFRALSGLSPRQYLATCHRLGGGVTAFVP